YNYQTNSVNWNLSRTSLGGGAGGSGGSGGSGGAAGLNAGTKNGAVCGTTSALCSFLLPPEFGRSGGSGLMMTCDHVATLDVLFNMGAGGNSSGTMTSIGNINYYD